MQLAKHFAVGTFFLASVAGAATVEKASFGAQPSCTCKSKSDCACGAKCTGKNCGAKKKVFESIKGAGETTRLPDTARHDVRGGVFI